MKKDNFKFNLDSEFELYNVENIGYLYFPLVNEAGMKSSITPSLAGDCKIDQSHFALLPQSQLDLHNSMFTRNIYFLVNNKPVYLNGLSPYQLLHKDEVKVKTGFIYFNCERKNQYLSFNTTSFVPSNNDFVELTKVKITNNSDKSVDIKSIVGIPLYCRSAETIRDHRHVTSLLNRCYIEESGIVNIPTMLFDETGHKKGDCLYGVHAKCSKSKIKQHWPLINSFTGEGNSLLNPQGLFEDINNEYRIGDEVCGEEVLGGIEFERFMLNPNETFEIEFMISITKTKEELNNYVNKYIINNSFDLYLNETKQYWKTKMANLTISTKSSTFDNWFNYVVIQPKLRAIYGCSVLPAHDYGKGGKGWRDLWQDCLALLMMEPSLVEEMLFNNFAGVRIDGSNATIIGSKPGEFKSDRNSITRVWCDHSIWPVLTTDLFVNRTGKLDFLLRKQVYFKDKFSHYTHKTNPDINNNDVVRLKNNKVYEGSILEHLIIQNLVSFYNVGEHGNLRLENADWNDALDMAKDKGESVAFTGQIGDNLIKISKMLLKLNEQGINEISLIKDIKCLLTNRDMSPNGKQKVLHKYFDSVENNVSSTFNISTLDLAHRLEKFGESFKKQVRKNEWLSKGQEGWFNSYYDNDGNRLDNIEKKHIMLTGQVFQLYSKIPTYRQQKKMIVAANRYLYEKDLGGYRLNSNFNEIKMNMGRMFGFAYGTKENGAVFSHMAVMYAAGLYRNNHVKEGYKVINSLYKQVMNTEKSFVLPGIPEYFDGKGRGMYHYLTGSASWLILVVVEEMFGVTSSFGDYIFTPKLLKSQFDKNGKASITTLLNDKRVTITYVNNKHLEFDKYQIKEVYLNDTKVEINGSKSYTLLKNLINGLNNIEIILG